MKKFVEHGIHVRAVRKATGLTQEKFASLVGICRPHLGDIEIGKRRLTEEVRNKIAGATDAWIEITDSGESSKPPVVLNRIPPFEPMDENEAVLQALFNEPSDVPYSETAWQEHQSRKIWPTNPAEDDLLYWLQLLLTASARDGKHTQVRSEIISNFTNLAKKHRLEPTINRILKSYKPTWGIEILDWVFTREGRFDGFKQKKWKALKWAPFKRFPDWARRAIDLCPLAIHTVSPKRGRPEWAKRLEEKSQETREKLRSLEPVPKLREESGKIEWEPSLNKIITFAKKNNLPESIIEFLEGTRLVSQASNNGIYEEIFKEIREDPAAFVEKSKQFGSPG